MLLWYSGVCVLGKCAVKELREDSVAGEDD